MLNETLRRDALRPFATAAVPENTGGGGIGLNKILTLHITNLAWVNPEVNITG